jgi:hypothetical protein
MDLSNCCSVITNNIQQDCSPSLGGMEQTMFVANYCDISGYTTLAGEVVTVDMKTDPITTNPFYFYRVTTKKNTAGVLNTLVKNDNNSYWETTVNFTIQGFSTQTKIAINDLIKSGGAVVVGRDKQGQWVVAGLKNDGLEATEGTLGTDVTRDGLYGGTFVLTGYDTEISPTIALGTDLFVLNEDGVTVDTVTLS